jgi:glyoxylase-like metal-dependent hydrolase (beta-lactamase superfamily II)
MRRLFLFVQSVLTVFVVFGFSGKSDPDWCSKQLRPELQKLREINTARPWFKVYKVSDDVFAIVEPYNYEEVISYLIIGKKKALLFDTGMGFDSISAVVKKLTALPVLILNSHTHQDHTGGNYEFSNILAMNTAYTRHNADHGWANETISFEVTPEAFCMDKLPVMDTAHYAVKPFHVKQFIEDGYRIDLGGRLLQVMATPGHTPDAIMLLDAANGYLWTGDSFYNGPIFLFDSVTDLPAYEKSMRKAAAMVKQLKTIYPAHNIPFANPGQLSEAYGAFMQIREGKIKGVEKGDNMEFAFDGFSFLIGKKLLAEKPPKF